MRTSSSSSSRQGGRRTVYGVPTKCWCGQDLDIWVSETKENPFRRFYRCKIARQVSNSPPFKLNNASYLFKFTILLVFYQHKPSETHLFKWIDKALQEKIWIVDAKRMDILHDLQALRENTQVQLDN